MNKKGFTLIEILATIVIIALIMLIILPSAQRISKENKETLHKEYEKMMVEYAKEKTGHYEYMQYLDEMDDALEKVKNDCRGYVTPEETENGTTEYHAYISCKDGYETPGFDENNLIRVR